MKKAFFLVVEETDAHTLLGGLGWRLLLRCLRGFDTHFLTGFAWLLDGFVAGDDCLLLWAALRL